MIVRHCRLAIVVIAPTQSRSIVEDTTRVIEARIKLHPTVCNRHLHLQVIILPPAYNRPIRRVRAGVLINIGQKAWVALEPVSVPVALLTTLHAALVTIGTPVSRALIFATDWAELEALLLHQTT